MRTFNAVLAVAALSLSFSAQSQAQVIVGNGISPAGGPVSIPALPPISAPAVVAAPTVVSVPASAPVLASAPVVYSSSYVAPYSSSYVPPYSYYAADPYPARIYVGYGSNDFPFYGQPYGYPTDKWSWAAMSTGRFGGLARYYYPPVR
jgi:hypothetical protein